MIFYTADMHLGHKAILEHCQRPFTSLEDMDNCLISYWNDIVSKEDIVYHIGDFAWKDADKYMSMLNGNIVFILGNHDSAIQKGEKSRSHIVKSHIHSISVDLKSIAPYLEDSEKQYIVMCHYAMRSWNKSHYGSWHIFGHSHGRNPPLGKSYDVGVDNNNFRPISHLQLKEIMDSLSIEKEEKIEEDEWDS